MQYKPTEKMKELFPDFERIEHSDGHDTLYIRDKYSADSNGMNVYTALFLGLIEEVKEKPKTVWDLREGDECFILCSDGEIVKSKYYGDDLHTGHRENGNIFLTRKEAEHELIRRKMRARAWKPEKEQPFFYFCAYIQKVEKWNDPADFTPRLSIINAGLAFPTHEECEEAMTQEVKEAFNLI